MPSDNDLVKQARSVLRKRANSIYVPDTTPVGQLPKFNNAVNSSRYRPRDGFGRPVDMDPSLGSALWHTVGTPFRMAGDVGRAAFQGMPNQVGSKAIPAAVPELIGAGGSWAANTIAHPTTVFSSPEARAFGNLLGWRGKPGIFSQNLDKRWANTLGEGGWTKSFGNAPWYAGGTIPMLNGLPGTLSGGGTMERYLQSPTGVLPQLFRQMTTATARANARYGEPNIPIPSVPPAAPAPTSLTPTNMGSAIPKWSPQEALVPLAKLPK